MIIASNDSVLVETHAYRKNYLLDGKAPSYFVLGGVPEQIDVDELELKLIDYLSHDARITLSDLAEKLNSSVDIVRHRINRLEQNGVISGYRIELNLSRIGMIFIKAMLTLRDRTLEEEQQLEKFCAESKRVMYFIRQLGSYPIELEMEIEDYSRFYQILEDLKEGFPGLVKNVETIFMRDESYRWAMG